VVKSMMLDGTYNKILNLETLQLDVNGDGIVELVFIGGANENTSAATYSIFYQPDNQKSNKTQYYSNGKLYTSMDEIPKNTKVPQ
ncbi:MAG: hypothetical protein AAGH46_06940, partial [Bacteroidota bacterium]